MREFLLSFVLGARKPVSWLAVAPLIAFLAAFAAVCLFLDLADIVLFASPAGLLAVLLAPWVWWMHLQGFGGLRGGRAQLALQIRLIALGMLAIVLAEPNWVTKHEQLSVVFLTDTSASIGPDMTDKSLAIINHAAGQRREKDHIGLIVYAKEAGVELPPRATYSLDEMQAVALQLDRDGTNIAEALGLALAVLPEESQGRVVLFGDGVETEGNLNATLDELNARGIAVDVVPIAYEYDKEVWLERMELPRYTKAGETYEAAVILSSLTDGAGTLVLRENGQIYHEQRVEYKAGKNRYSIPIPRSREGFYEYEAIIETDPGEDQHRRNNRAISYIYLEGERKVLLVVDPDGEALYWNEIDRALRESQRKVDVVNAFDMPGDTLKLLPYDAIIFANVGREQFTQLQLESVQQAVRDQGTGFLAVGGENSFGPGGYNNSPIEEILPVDMEITQRKVMPKGALVICLHTCEFPEGNWWGKQIAKAAIDVLGQQDDVAVSVYDYQKGDSWLFPLTPVSQKAFMFQKIEAAQIGDMPAYSPTMNMALNELKASDAAVKHMIIISDGDPTIPPASVLQQFVDNKITVATVAVFPHGGTTTGTLKRIANATGGNFYYPQDPAQLPQIFIKEAKTLKRSMISNATFTPTMGMEVGTNILRGITALPQLRGYVLTTPKSNASIILEGPEEEEVDPVLAVWKYGTGQTAAWTSDLSTNWAADWVNWEKFQAFVNQLVTQIARVNRPSQIRMQTFAAGNEGIVSVEDYADDAGFLNLAAKVELADGESIDVPLNQIGPRRYEGRFPLSGEGRYWVAVGGGGDGRTEQSVGGFVVPYSNEYLRFRADPIRLASIAERTGGRVLTGEGASNEADFGAAIGKEIFGVDREERSTSKPRFEWLLILLACIIPLDVGLRRVHIDWATVAGWFSVRRSTETDRTMSSLRKRKQAVSDEISKKREHDPPSHIPRRRPPPPVIDEEEPPATPASRSNQDAGDTKTANDDASTTGRLLDLKRKRRNTDDDDTN